MSSNAKDKTNISKHTWRKKKTIKQKKHSRILSNKSNKKTRTSKNKERKKSANKQKKHNKHKMSKGAKKKTKTTKHKERKKKTKTQKKHNRNKISNNAKKRTNKLKQKKRNKTKEKKSKSNQRNLVPGHGTFPQDYNCDIYGLTKAQSVSRTQLNRAVRVNKKVQQLMGYSTAAAKSYTTTFDRLENATKGGRYNLQGSAARC